MQEKSKTKQAKQENYYQKFEKRKLEYCEEIKIAYAKQIEKGEANFVHWKFKNLKVDNRSGELQRILGDYDSIMRDIIEARKWDNTQTVEELFNEKFTQIEPNKRNKILEFYSEFEGLKLFEIFWREQSKIYLGESQKKPKAIEPKLVTWLGDNETEFVQLIYSLFDAKFLTNDENERTKLVQQVAELFNFPLTKNWQSKLSTSITKRNKDYTPEIFQRLKEAFIEYRKERESKNKKK